MSYTDDDAFVAWGGGNYDYLANGPSNFGFVTITDGNNPNFNIGASAGGNVWGVVGYAGQLADDGATFGPRRNDYASSAGVLGASLQFTGVAGTTDGLQPGVYGQCGDAGDVPLHLQAGVLGASLRFTGVLGRSVESAGVTGQSTGDYGVWGTSMRNTGVVGQTGGGFGPRFTDPNNPAAGDVRSTPAGVLGTTRETFGVAGTSFKTSGVLGQSGAPPKFEPKSTYTAGVIGTSRDAAGVAGVSQNAPGVLGRIGASGPDGGFGAVVGTADAFPGVVGSSIDRFGVVGISTNQAGVYGQSAKTFAGFFDGNVLVGNALSAAVKNAIVPFPDGSQRLLHCVESPEHWFEDFGSARLNRGRASIKFDADFAKVVKLSDYRVFLTPEGDCNGLYVKRKRGAFEVRELQAGMSNVRFSYRIVARRKDIVRHKRFEKLDARGVQNAAARLQKRA